MPFITFDGPECAGKSTQLKMLEEAVSVLFPGREFVFTREPGGSPYGERIRDLFFSGMKDTSARTQLGLMMASRFDHAEKTIRPRLEEGKVVVSDRYAPASFAYQVAADPSLEPLYREHLKLVPKPDLSILLMVPAEVTVARLAERRGAATAFDAAGVEFHERIERGYAEYHHRFGHIGCVTVDGYRSQQAVHEEIISLIRLAIR
jgi:dTMP kinase